MKRSFYRILTFSLIGLLFTVSITVVSAFLSGTEVLASPQTSAKIQTSAKPQTAPAKTASPTASTLPRANPLRKERNHPTQQPQPQQTQQPQPQQTQNSAVRQVGNVSKVSTPITTASHTAPVATSSDAANCSQLDELPTGNFEEMGNFGDLGTSDEYGDLSNFDNGDNLDKGNIDVELPSLDSLPDLDTDSVPVLSTSESSELSEPQPRPSIIVQPSPSQSATASPPTAQPSRTPPVRTASSPKKVTRPITARNTAVSPSETENHVAQVDHTREVAPAVRSATPVHSPTHTPNSNYAAAQPKLQQQLNPPEPQSPEPQSSESRWNESQASPRVGSLERPSIHPPSSSLSPSLQFSTLQPPVASSVPQSFPDDVADNQPEDGDAKAHTGFQEGGIRGADEPEGIGTPGESTLFGIQAPILEMEKIAPKEVQLNQPTIFKIIIRNKGLTTAKDIILQDRIPRGTRLLSTHPALANGSGGDLYWSLGSLAPQEEIVVEMKLVPLVEGEFGSVATVHFATEASSASVATQAMLQLEVSSKPNVLIGEKITYNLTLSNPGTGTAKGVVLELDVPDGLQHPQGRRIQSPVGDLKAKETKQFPLTLLSSASGVIATQIHARGDNNLESVATANVEVLAPELQLQIAGPRQRFLDRKAAYTLSVKNPGTASAHSVDLTVKLPHGIKFENTNQKGVYNEKAHTVHWTLKELPARDAGEIELVLIPIREGEHLIRFEGVGEKNLKSETKHDVSVQGIPSIGFNVTCLTNPIEVGRTANYEVKLFNRGTKAASNVVVNVRLSEGMQYSTADGATRHRTHSGVIQFEPIGSLESKQEKIYRFSAKCMEIGDHRISVSVSSDELKAPVTKEESTLVYGDQ